MLSAFLAPIVHSQTLVITPNPFEQRTGWSYTLPAADTVTLKVYDPAGKIVRSVFENTPLATGLYHDSLIMYDQPHGIYLAILETRSGKKSIQKLIKTGSVGLTEKQAIHDIVVYPNPSKQSEAVQLRAISPIHGHLHYAVFNGLGEKISAGKLKLQHSHFELPPDLVPGVYTVLLRSDTGAQSFKIVKQ